MEFYISKFRTWRKDKKYSLKDIAEKTGVSWQTIWNWENKKFKPSEAKIRHLCNCLGVDLSHISDIKTGAESSDCKLNNITDSWLAFIEPEIKKNIENEKMIVESVRIQSEKLQKTTILLSSLLSCINVMFYVKDLKLKYMIASDQFLENLSLVTNYSSKGKSDFDFFSPKEAKENMKQDQKVIDTGVAIENYEGYIPGTRKQKWGLISKTPIFDSNSKIAGIVGSFIDITERKKAETKKELLDVCVEFMSDGFGIFELDTGKILYKNEKYCDFLGISKDSPILQNCIEIGHQVLKPKDAQIMENIYKTKQFEKVSEHEIINFNKQKKCLQVLRSRRQFRGKDCLICIFRDIT
ncbi:MAG: PAS domain-containing protein [bacterium]|nr:PAS domain-containing protein [bacterium]